MRNPEGRRLLWLMPLELVALLVTPILALTFLIVFLEPAISGDPWQKVLATAQFLSGVAVLSAAIAAGHSFEVELRQRTWDWQRLSALGPFELGWGKMIGAGAGPWYVVALTQAVAWFANGRLEPPSALALEQMLAASFVLFVAGLGLQALSVAVVAFASTQRRSPTEQQAGSATGAILGLALCAPFIGSIGAHAEVIPWFALRPSAGLLGVASAVVLLGAGLLLMDQGMRVALQATTRPWVTPLLMATFMVYTAGFIQIAAEWRELALLRAANSAILAFLLVYGGLAVGRGDPMALRRFQLAWRDRRGMDLARVTPAWGWALLFFLASTLACLALVPDHLDDELPGWLLPRAAILHLVALVLRDVAIWLCLAAHPRIVRVDFIAFGLYALLHLALPLLFHLLDTDLLRGGISMVGQPTVFHGVFVLATTVALLHGARDTWARRMDGLAAG